MAEGKASTKEDDVGEGWGVWEIQAFLLAAPRANVRLAWRQGMYARVFASYVTA